MCPGSHSPACPQPLTDSREAVCLAVAHLLQGATGVKLHAVSEGRHGTDCWHEGGYSQSHFAKGVARPEAGRHRGQLLLSWLLIHPPNQTVLLPSCYSVVELTNVFGHSDSQHCDSEILRTPNQPALVLLLPVLLVSASFKDLNRLDNMTQLRKG